MYTLFQEHGSSSLNTWGKQCKIYWQSSGDYIVVKIDRAKSKKHIVTTFELYRLREKDVPVDVLEANPEEEIGQIFWEPYGSRFVVLGQEGQKQVAHFYEVLDPTKTGAVPVTNADMLGNINLVRSVETKGVNTVSWSPRGRFCILAGIRSHTGTLQFWDTQENVLLASEEHYACTNIEWDPTGRYVATCVSSWHVQTDTGFMMWTFTGSVITREIIHGFKQFLWRPRPPTLLSDKDLKKIRKNLKEYSRDFDVEDMAEKNKASREVVEKRKEQMEEWKILAERWAEEYESQREERIALYGFDPQEALAETDEWVPLPVLASAK